MTITQQSAVRRCFIRNNTAFLFNCIQKYTTFFVNVSIFKNSEKNRFVCIFSYGPAFYSMQKAYRFSIYRLNNFE